MALTSNQFISAWSLGANDVVGVEIPQSPVNPNIGTYGWRSIGIPSITTGSGTKHLAYLSAVEGDANRANSEVLTIMQAWDDGAVPYFAGVALRASGAAGSETGYFAIIAMDSATPRVALGKIVSGGTWTEFGSVDLTGLTSAPEDWYIRFRVNGTSLKLKTWRYDSLEPSTWAVTATDSAIAGVGKVGFFCLTYAANAAGFFTPGFISVGTNGETAPRPRSDQDLRLWLNDDSNPRVVLAEVGVLGQTAEGAANDSYTLLSNAPFITKASDNPPNQVYDDIIVEVPTMRKAANEQLTGRSSLAYGDLVVKNEDGVRSHWLNWNWDGRDFQMYIGGIGWRQWDFVRVLTGTVAEVYESGRDKIGFKIRDNSALLNRKLQSTVIGGSDANAGAPQPVVFGKVFNIEPVLKSGSALRYKFHDASLTGSTGITAVRDSGVAVTPTADLANGEFTLGATPGGRVTMDVTNDLSAGTVTKSGNTHARALQTIVEDRVGLGASSTYKGGRSGSLANFGDFSVIGLYVKSEANVMDLLDQIVISAGGFWYFNQLGLFCARQLAVPVAPYDHELFEDDVQVSPGLALEKLFLPSEAQQLGYQANSTVQEDGLAGSVSAANRALYGAPAQFTAIAPSYSGLDQPSNHALRRRPPSRGSLFSESTGAATEATRLDLLNRKATAIFSFTTKHNAAFYDLGESLLLTHSKYGFEAGKAGLIIGLEKNFGKSTTTIRLFVQLDGGFPVTTAAAPYVTAEDFY